LLFFTVAVVIHNEYFVDHCFFGSVVLFVTGIIQNVVMYRRYNCPKCMDSSQFLAGLVVLSVFYVHRAWRRRVPRSLLLSLQQQYDSMLARMCRSDNVKASLMHFCELVRMLGLDGPDVEFKQFHRVASSK